MASIIKSNTYADFNGREILTANNDGALTTQKTLYPAFLANLSSNQDISNTTETTVAYATEVYDTDSAYNNSTYTFTVPSGKAGKYYLFAHVSFVDFSLGNSIRVFLRMYKNTGRLMSTGEFQKANTGSASWNGFVSTVADLSEGDDILIKIYHNSGSTETISSLSDASNFGGFRIGS